MMEEILRFNTENYDQEIMFLLRLVANVPRLRLYPKRPDIFENLYDSEFCERFLSKKRLVDFAEIFSEQLKTSRSNALPTTTIKASRVLFLHHVWHGHKHS